MDSYDNLNYFYLTSRAVLDSDSRDSLFRVIDDAVHEGTGVLMVSHDPVVESFVDSVITMEKDDANHE